MIFVRLNLQTNLMLMRLLVILVFVFLFGCQAKLTDEQKKELREGMDANKIVKISEAEITQAAFSFGRKIADEVKQLPNLSNPELERLEKAYKVDIFPLAPGDSLLLAIEQQIIEAYTSAKGLDLTDNIQKIGTDTLLYTHPVLSTRSDGSVQFNYALGIRMPKKEVILSIQED